MRLSDIARDTVIEIDSRRSRAVMMLIAIALSVGSLIAAYGMSVTAARQVDSELAAAMLNEVTVTAAPGARLAGPVFPADAQEQVARVQGVNSCGLRLNLAGRIPGVSSRLGLSVRGDTRIAGVTPGYMQAASITATSQSWWLLGGSEPVAFLGSGLAADLGIPAAANLAGYSMDLDGVAYSIVGVVTAPEAFERTIFLPYSLALKLLGSDQDAVMLVKTEAGAGAVISNVVRLAIRPASPQSLQASQVIDAGDLRLGVSTQLGRLIGGVGAFLLALSVLLISNSMVISVNSRAREIGLRRAMGASRRAVAGLFLCEGALLGAVGGLIGGVVATWAVVTISAAYQWSVAVSVLWTLGGLLLGMVSGIVSAVYPAWRAGSVEPALAVRSD